MLSTFIVWIFTLLDLVIFDLSREKLNNSTYYLVQSLNALFNRDLIAPILILAAVYLTFKLLNRARNTLIIEDVQGAEKKNEKKEKNSEKKESPNYHLMLIEELNKIYQIYSDVDKQRPIKTSMAEKCDITSASLRSGSLDNLLNSATLSDLKVSFGSISIPLGLILSLANRLLKGPRLLLSVDQEDETVRLSAVLVSPRNLSWQVARQIPRAQSDDASTVRPTKKQPDREILCTEMVRELAHRIFTGMTHGKTQRWESTRAFLDGLYYYRKGLRAPKDQIFYLKEAEDKFVEALGYDEGYKFAWYNLGVVYSEMKRYNAAEEAFSRATEIDQTRWEPYYAKAVTIWHRMITEGEKVFCEKSTPESPPCCNKGLLSILRFIILSFTQFLKSFFNSARWRDQNKNKKSCPSPSHQDEVRDPTAKYREIIANLDQAERILEKKRLKNVPEVFKFRGETYLRIYRERGERDDLDRAINDLREATLAAWRRYRTDLALSPTTVPELAREETACRMMQESLSSLTYAYAHAHSNGSGAECLISHAVSIDPTCHKTHFARGQIHLKGKQWEEAAGAFGTATEIAPHMMKYCLALAIAECLVETQKMDGCSQAIKKKIDECFQIIEKKGNEFCKGMTEEEWIEIDEIIKGLNNEKSSQKIIKVITELDDTISELHRTCCTIRQNKITEIASCEESQEGEKNKIYETWESYWNEPLKFQEHYDLACLHYQNRRYKLAIELWTTALPLRPLDPSAAEYIGIASVKEVISSHPQNYKEILKKGEENLENALRIYKHRYFEAKKAQNQNKKIPDVFLRGIVRTYYWLGRLLSIRQKYPEAIEKFQLARQLAEESCTDYEASVPKVALTYRLAWAYLRNREYDLAKDLFETVTGASGNCVDTDLSRNLEDDITIPDIRFCSHLGLAYSFLLRGIAPDEVLRCLDEAKLIPVNDSHDYASCHDFCLGLYGYTRYLTYSRYFSYSKFPSHARSLSYTENLSYPPSFPGTRTWYLKTSIVFLTRSLEGRPTAGKYIALARACISLGELEEVKAGSEKKPGIPAQMPYLSRAQECLAHARKMDHYRRHTDEIERLNKRVERYLTI
ncbi:tetratricopeptide repeat protein [Methanofollis aquaemaris]|uniref:tetratricopeptide repeat protein n=1 Tax=Methanofollis aquaemaris TaxID=126734 RepID=UPI00223FBB86|nr:tetratricopeptide repeat protein [Methanofollis aquaemaris]